MNLIKHVLMDQKFYESVEEVDVFLQEEDVQDGSVIQTLIFDKEVFETQAEAVEWASSHGFHSDKVDDTGDSFIIRQLDPSEFMEDSFRTIELRRGVSAVVGLLKPAIESSDPFYFSLRTEQGIKLSGDNPHIIEIAKVVDGVHPNYGRVTITKDMLKSFLRNFNENAVGVDLSIDFDHETREAAGWVKSVFLDFSEEVLLAEVRWTPKGAISLNDREFRYFSPEFSLNYIHPHTGKEYGPTLLGGALVNRPFLKMDAIVSLKNKHEGDLKMETIALSEHKAKVSDFERQLSEYKLSEEKSKTVISSLTEDNKKLSERVSTLESEAKKREVEAKNKKLFDEGKISAAQLTALNEGKDLYEVLSLSEKMNTEAKGTEGSRNDMIELSDAEKAFCAKMDMSPEDYIKYNREA